MQRGFEWKEASDWRRAVVTWSDGQCIKIDSMIVQ